MRYENQNMSAAAKIAHLELLLAQSNPLVDAISLASLRSKAELTVVADKCRDILRDVAHDDGIVLLRGVYDSVPIIGDEEDPLEELEACFVSQHEADLEMNLALVYTALIHCKGVSSFEERDQLITRAYEKLYADNALGRMMFFYKFSVGRYMDAASFVSEGRLERTDDRLQKHLQETSDLLWKAQNTAEKYAAYLQFMIMFNLGRVEFLRGENKGLTRDYFQRADSLARKVGNKSFVQLARHYVAALDDDAQFGTVIDDPPEYKTTLIELVTETLSPRRERERSILLPPDYPILSVP